MKRVVAPNQGQKETLVVTVWVKQPFCISGHLTGKQIYGQLQVIRSLRTKWREASALIYKTVGTLSSGGKEAVVKWKNKLNPTKRERRKSDAVKVPESNAREAIWP